MDLKVHLNIKAITNLIYPHNMIQIETQILNLQITSIKNQYMVKIQ